MVEVEGDMVIVRMQEMEALHDMHSLSSLNLQAALDNLWAHAAAPAGIAGQGLIDVIPGHGLKQPCNKLVDLALGAPPSGVGSEDAVKEVVDVLPSAGNFWHLQSAFGQCIGVHGEVDISVKHSFVHLILEVDVLS